MKKFYEKVLPSSGVYCVTGIKNGKPQNLFAESHGQLYNLIDRLKATQHNVFVTPNSFKSESRTAANALYAKSFFIDLDVGDTPKKYASQVEALQALDKFIDSFELPPPVLVNTGNGVHAYWVFDADVPIEDWKTYAKLFKEFCKSHIKIDSVVTADAARIMRCPDTLNYKSDPPKGTGVWSPEIYEYSFDLFKDFLNAQMPSEPGLKEILANVPKGLDEDMSKVVKSNNFDTNFSIIVNKSLVGSGCEQIKYAVMNAATLDEPTWYAALSIAWHCEDKEEAIHSLSEDHPGYDREKTYSKAKQTTDKPQSCIQFDAVNPGICAACPHRGKITNPLFFGRVLKIAPTEENPVWSDPDSEEIPVFPYSLKPYVRGAAGGIFYLPPPEKDEDGVVTQEPPTQIFKYTLFPVRRMYSPHDGDCLVMRVAMPHDGYREFNLPTAAMQSPEQLNTILPKHGAMYDPNQKLHVIRYLRKWSEYMADMKIAEQMRMQMGWTESKDAFVIGNHEIIATGEERVAPASPFVRGIAKILVKQGSYSAWKQSFNALNTPGFELHAFGGLIGFGSTLMTFTTTSGAVVSFIGESGVAKTGALYACLSVWGNPKELSVFDATENGMVGRYLGLHNLPLGCDEVSNRKADQLSNLIHRVSHGKAKIRMQASVNAEREIEFSAALLALFTTNQSVADKMVSLKGSPDGELARIIEFTVNKPSGLTPAKGKLIFDTFRSNYGWAGPEFIKYCFKLGFEEIKARIEKWSKRFNEDFGQVVAYRFYDNTTAATFAAGEIAVEAEIIKLDLERIYTHVVGLMCAIRDHTPVNNTDFKALVGEFVNRNQRSFLVLDNGKVLAEPYNILVGRTEVHNSMRYIAKTEFRKFLSEYQVSVRQFELVLKAEGMLTYIGKQRLSTGWKAGQTTPPIAVYGFKMDLVEDVIDEITG
jgi:hypothetical protein